MVRFSVWLVSACYAHVFVRLWLVIVTDRLYDSAWWGIDESGKQEPHSQARSYIGTRVGGCPQMDALLPPKRPTCNFFFYTLIFHNQCH